MDKETGETLYKLIKIIFIFPLYILKWILILYSFEIAFNLLTDYSAKEILDAILKQYLL